MIIQATDGDCLVLTKTTLSEQGRNSNVPSRTRSYVHLVDLIPALNFRCRIDLYPLPGGWRDPHRSWMFTTAYISTHYPGYIGCKTFGEAATKKIRKAVRAALKQRSAMLKPKKGSNKKKK